MEVLSMKKFLLVGLLAAGLVGCAQTQTTTKTTETQRETVKNKNEKVINFTGPYDLTIKLWTIDNFETAIMSDNSGKRYNLQQVPAANGIKLESSDGASIHFKQINGKNEGIVNLVPGKNISVTEFK